MKVLKNAIPVYNGDKLQYALIPYSDCLICLDYPVKPISTLCGHVFCYECLYELYNHNKFCVCNQYIKHYIDVQFILYEDRLEINEVEMYKQIEALKVFEDKKKVTENYSGKNEIGNGVVKFDVDNAKKINDKKVFGFETCIMRFGSYESDLICNLRDNPIAARYQIDEIFFLEKLGTNYYHENDRNLYKAGLKEFCTLKPNQDEKTMSETDIIKNNIYMHSLINNTYIQENRFKNNQIKQELLDKQKFDENCRLDEMCLENPENSLAFIHTLNESKTVCLNKYDRNEATKALINKKKQKDLREKLILSVSYQKLNGEPFFMSKKSIKDLGRVYTYENLPEYLEVAIVNKKEVIYSRDDKNFADGFLKHLCEGRKIYVCDVCFDP